MQSYKCTHLHFCAPFRYIIPCFLHNHVGITDGNINKLMDINIEGVESVTVLQVKITFCEMVNSLQFKLKK